MTNFEKYFGNTKKASETLEKIMFGQINICKDLCNFKNDNCVDNELLDNYSCCHGIRYFLESKDKDEKNKDNIKNAGK